MLFPHFGNTQSLALGTYGPWPLTRTFRLSLERAKAHMHIIGVSDSGKSRFMAWLYVSLLELGVPATLIDPHGDLSRLVLMLLIERGVYTRAEAYEPILYFDLADAERRDRYLPLNVLHRTGKPQTIAAQTMEAFHRAWPGLGPVCKSPIQ
jgi:DNA helicase HerA-like ATPase